MKQHELKCWPDFFDAMREGRKTFEVRRNDRGFQTGDILVLRCFDPTPKPGPHQEGWVPMPVGYTLDQPLMRRVTYVLSGFGIESGYVVMGLEPHYP